MLRAIGIYPHGIHVIVEGESEEVVVPGVVESLSAAQQSMTSS